MIWKEFRRKQPWPKWGTILEFFWTDRGKQWETSVRIAGDLAEIRTKHHLNISLEHYL
jgi:hypothetical protein